ncbi:MAG: 4Fe-4S binding protein [Candidatus Paceibacterota bacterium]
MEEKKYQVDKEKCIGCGSCAMVCPGGTEMKDDGKAEVISSSKIEECGGIELCPYGAIIELNGAIENDEEE